MVGWEQARNELNQAQARQEQFKELAEDAAHRLVRVLDPRVRQFVQTLHDHNQWPMISREITEEKTTEEKKGLLRKRVPRTRLEKKAVTEPSIVKIGWRVEVGFTYHAGRTYGKNATYDLTISPSQEWTLSTPDDRYESSYKAIDPIYIFRRTAEGTQIINGSQLLRESGPDRRGIRSAIDLDALSNGLIKQMANYLVGRGLPLPQD